MQIKKKCYNCIEKKTTENNMYDKKRILKPEYTLTESEKRAMLFNNDIKIINQRTDFGKGISFKNVDGHEYGSMEAAESANKAFFDRMIIDKPLEKRYLSYISEVLKQYGYNQQDSNKKIKK